MSKTSTYTSWYRMRRRCNYKKDPSYKHYGERGITYDSSWDDFQVFRDYLISSGIGFRPSKRHSLDRIDNEGHYVPGNIQWSLPKTQCRNKRNNHLIAFKGKTQTLTAWSQEIGMSLSGLSTRLERGWSIERSLTEPSEHRLTEEDALEILRSGDNPKILAKRFNISPSMVWKIKTGKNWTRLSP